MHSALLAGLVNDMHDANAAMHDAAWAGPCILNHAAGPWQNITVAGVQIDAL